MMPNPSIWRALCCFATQRHEAYFGEIVDVSKWRVWLRFRTEGP